MPQLKVSKSKSQKIVKDDKEILSYLDKQSISPFLLENVDHFKSYFKKKRKLDLYLDEEQILHIR